MKYIFSFLFVINFSYADMLILKGAAGASEFSEPLKSAAEKWRVAAKKGEIEASLFEGDNAKESFLEALAKLDKKSLKPLWIIYLGHGTYINGVAKLNLKGNDISAEDLKKALSSFEREVILINCASASAPFLTALSGSRKVIVTATKNQAQVYYTKFNEIMAGSISLPEADFDKDGQTSLLESYLYASHKVKAFYDADKRLSGENALIDDNGDKKGSLAEMFEGLHAKKKDAKIDGFRAHQIHLVPSEEEKKMSPEQLKQRDTLELELYNLRQRKSKLGETEYYSEIEVILKKLGNIYSQSK